MACSSLWVMQDLSSTVVCLLPVKSRAPGCRQYGQDATCPAEGVGWALGLRAFLSLGLGSQSLSGLVHGVVGLISIWACKLQVFVSFLLSLLLARCLVVARMWLKNGQAVTHTPCRVSVFAALSFNTYPHESRPPDAYDLRVTPNDYSLGPNC